MDKKPSHKHKVLIVCDEKNAEASIVSILEKDSVAYRCTQNATQALKEIKFSKQPFSLIIADQQIPGINGTDFLDYTKAMTPHTIRFLITDDTGSDTVSELVNRGAVHRFIIKPWDNDRLLVCVRNALRRFERTLEDELALKKTTQQNRKLFELNNELKEMLGKQEAVLFQLNKALCDTKALIKRQTEITNTDPEQLVSLLETIFADQGKLDSGKLSAFYSDVTKKIFLEFEEYANRNGFEMPEI